eukprot:TRINITY_DN7544_c0_g1_i1.p1 TRINITY_DN7544_c0_g1~~TRINITY_DN7544_c0_g1_i1.p1  ORF type:complete len:376 (-),score=68.70 TRINITY_DN7544_c0_g1_i1:91-1218(-)
MNYPLFQSEKKRKLPSVEEDTNQDNLEGNQAPTTPPLPDVKLPQDAKTEVLFEMNSFIQYYVLTTDIVTLYDLNSAICEMNNVYDFNQLGVGDILQNSEVQKYFSPPSSMNQIPPITSTFVSLRLFAFVKENTGKNITEEDFLEMLAKERNMQSAKQLCVKVQNFIRFTRSFGAAQKAKRAEAKPPLLSTPVDPDISKAIAVRSLDLKTLHSNFSHFMGFFSNFTKENIVVGVSELQPLIFGWMQAITNFEHFRMYYAFEALLFHKFWKNKMSISGSEFRKIRFTLVLEKIMGYCEHYNDFQILQLAFVLDLKIPERRSEQEKEFEQLSYMISKMMRGTNIRFDYRHPFVAEILVCKGLEFESDQIVDKVFTKYI